MRKGKGMTLKTKIKIMVTVTVLMTVGFIMMDQVPRKNRRFSKL